MNYNSKLKIKKSKKAIREFVVNKISNKKIKIRNKEVAVGFVKFAYRFSLHQTPNTEQKNIREFVAI
jgi:hypothetical protein